MVTFVYMGPSSSYFSSTHQNVYKEPINAINKKEGHPLLLLLRFTSHKLTSQQ